MNQASRPGLSCAVWRKSSHSSADNECVEVARNLTGIVAVRDSKDPGGPRFIFTTAQWAAFTGHIKSGGFDPS